MRNYAQTVEYLFSMLPMFQNIGKEAFKKDLTNTLLLLDACGNPHKKQKYIHVTGSNGKGSVSSFLASILTENGYKTGLYTSPHLIDYTERIRINGVPIDEQFVIQWVNYVEPVIAKIKPSFFELTVVLALDYFAQQKCDISIIEVGLGGRLDSTNVINPIASIITNIALEHTDMLGDTKAKIAYEKAGIIKKNTPAIIGEIEEETIPIFKEKCLQENAPISVAEEAPKNWFKLSGLKGNYQKKNLATVYTTLKTLNLKLDINNIENGLKNVIKNAGILGRWQQIGTNPLTFVDTAHNAHGIANLAIQINAIEHQNLHIVIGVVKEKDIDAIAHILPKNANYYCCKPNVIRGKNAQELKSELEIFGFKCMASEKPINALNLARSNANHEDLIVVTGSNFVVGDILAATKYDQ